MDFPLRFTPFVRPMVWGGRRLGEVLGKPLPGPGPFGESWEVSDHPVHRSAVALGPLAGRTLQQLMAERGAELTGRPRRAFPWLVKYLDAHDWLSVQVHPDDDKVQRLLPGEGGKTEAWFVLDARPGSRVYAGLLPGTDEARLRAALANGTVADCLHSFQPRPGDCVFLPAGTVHAVGGGVLMAEVQQTSDATFRLFDWDRRDARGKGRPLHVEESLAAIDWSRGPVRPVQVPGFSPDAPENGSAPRLSRELVRCRHFELAYRQDTEPFTCGGRGRLQVLLVLCGSGRLTAGGADWELRRGTTWALPATLPEVRCRPEPALGVLLSTLPDAD